jgi:Uma2 family endonuclease
MTLTPPLAPPITEDDIRAVEHDPRYRDAFIRHGVWVFPTPEEHLHMASPEHGRLAFGLGFFLRLYLQTHPIGALYSSDTLYVLSGTPDGVQVKRRPDLSFVRAERVQRIFEGYYYLAPDLAVEVISPTEHPKAVSEKVSAYLTYGTSAVWLVYPQVQEIVVHEGGTLRAYGAGDTLDGGAVLAGFQLPLHALFQA